MSGELFSGLLLDDADQRALALEALLVKVVDDDTRVVWVGNPLRSPLTIERFLIQIVGPEIDLREERGPAEFAQIIAKPVGRESRLLVVVQQPETINAETREMLVSMGGALDGEAVQVQFVFAGSSAFVVPRLCSPEISTFSARLQRAEAQDTDPAFRGPRRRDVLPLLLLLLTITVGTVIAMAPASQDGMVAANPPQVVAIANAPAPAPPPPSVLRREFDAFLAQRTPALPPMTDSEKDALFTAFLTHHRRE